MGYLINLAHIQKLSNQIDVQEKAGQSLARYTYIWLFLSSCSTNNKQTVMDFVFLQFPEEKI